MPITGPLSDHVADAKLQLPSRPIMAILLGTTTNEPGRANMAKQVTCDCGFMLRTPSDDELVKHVQLHAKDTHSMDLTPEQALARAVSVEATIQA